MQAWDNFLQAQEAELGAETVNKWLRSLKILRFDAGNLYLEAKDPFQVLWFDEHIKSKLQRTFVNNNNRKIKVHLSLLNAAPKSKTPKTKPKTTPQVAPKEFVLSFDSLDPYCTFSNFCRHEKNELTLKILDNEYNSFNPVYLHGGVGSGKTHLLMAMAHALKEKGLKVIYCGAQTFTDHVVSAIRAGEMGIFRNSYRNTDVLIIDDIHVFSRKGATQEEFFHTFNTLHMGGKQLILSANCAPNELKLIEQRLISRFEWGIVLPLEMPLQDTFPEIIKAKAEAMHFPLHEKVIDYLATTFYTTKSLCRALEAIILRSHLNQSTSKIPSAQLTVSALGNLIDDLIQEERQVALTPPKIIDKVAQYFAVRPDDLKGKAQTREFVLPRQLAMYFCRTLMKIPYVHIGELFGRDHSTVMSSVRAIQAGIENEDAEISQPARSILKKIKDPQATFEKT